MKTYKESTEKKIARYKNQRFCSTIVSGTIGKKTFELVFLTRECEENKQIISLLSKWRRRHAKWFIAQFPVTNARTKAWYRERLMDDTDRLLFMVRVSDTYIGHVGLHQFDFDKKTCQIDNIIRGEAGYPGLMREAITAMMAWGRNALSIRGYTLLTSSDNTRALSLYNRLGFIETHRKPLVYQKTSAGGEWVEAPAGYTKPIARYDVAMKLTHSKSTLRGPAAGFPPRPPTKGTPAGGGPPTRVTPQLRPSVKKISFAGPWMTKKEERYVLDAVRNGWYETFDKDIKQLESKMAKYVGMNYALAGFCATHSMHLACIVCGFKKGDEVIVTDFSWAATAHVIAYTGATPVFVDIEPDTWCIDPKAIEKAITKKTKGIMLVHTFGMPADMDAIMKIARKYKLKVIEDAAPALGSLYHGKKVGGFGDVGCFSFHGAKIAASGEGGMFLTNSKAMLEEAILQSNMGRTDRLANFWCDTLGFEYQMANVTAALARAQVERIEELVAKKRKIFDWYWARLKDVPELMLLKEKKGTRSNYAYPAVLLKTNTISRDNVVRALRTYNIHAREAFPRMSMFPMYTARFPNPVASEVAKNGFNLPSAFNLTEKDVDFVCTVLKRLIIQ